MKKSILVSAVIAGLSFGVSAEQPSYNFVEAGIVKYDDDDSTKLLGNFEINENFYGVASYELLSEETFFGDVDLTILSLGAGYKMPLNKDTSFFAQVEYTDYEIDTSFGSGSEDGYNLTVGVRSMVAENTELFGEIANKNIDSSTATTLGLGVRQSFTDNFGAYARYDRDDFGDDSYGVGVSLKF
ncbi:MAG: hypothetical protein HWE27_09830 [Gammaproteobacteria bacterium]|nr:hypothetical protein [Gammaproteobacteria bacterium]